MSSSPQEIYLIRYPHPSHNSNSGRAIHALGNYFKSFTVASEHKDLSKEVTKPINTDLLCAVKEEDVETLLDLARGVEAPRGGGDLKSGLPNCQTWLMEYVGKCVEADLFGEEVLEKVRGLHEEAVAAANASK